MRAFATNSQIADAFHHIDERLAGVIMSIDHIVYSPSEEIDQLRKVTKERNDLMVRLLRAERELDDAKRFSAKILADLDNEKSEREIIKTVHERIEMKKTDEELQLDIEVEAKRIESERYCGSLVRCGRCYACRVSSESGC